jgi:hypothetical protein
VDHRDHLAEVVVQESLEGLESQVHLAYPGDHVEERPEAVPEVVAHEHVRLPCGRIGVAVAIRTGRGRKWLQLARCQPVEVVERVETKWDLRRDARHPSQVRVGAASQHDPIPDRLQ